MQRTNFKTNKYADNYCQQHIQSSTKIANIKPNQPSTRIYPK